MRVIFWFMGVICFLYGMLTTSFPKGNGRGKKEASSRAAMDAEFGVSCTFV
jgi:hypothetical protein